MALADRAGANVIGAYEWGLGDKTSRANAALIGLGRTRRILVSDTMLADYSDDEIEVVLAHALMKVGATLLPLSPRLTEAEQSFLDHEVETVCAMVDDWRVTRQGLDIPADAWSRISNEPSQVKRVRIARVAVGLPPSEVELTEAAGLAEPPALVKISTTPAGTLLVRGDRLALMQDRGRWAWFTSGYEYSDAHFNSAGFGLEARVLVTGIAETAWPDLRNATSNLERVRIAVAAGTVSDDAPAPPTPASAPATPAPEVTGELPGVSQEMLDELSMGLFDPRVHINAAPAVATIKEWLASSPSTLRVLLHAAGIECDHQTREKWRASVLFAGRTPDQSIFVRSLESMTPREVAISLLKATPMRRLHAHAWLHRGVLARLRTWTDAGSSLSDEAMLDVSLYEGKTRDTWLVYPGGPLGRLASHPGIRISIPEVRHEDTAEIAQGVIYKHDDAWVFGRTLRQVTSGLWDLFRMSRAMWRSVSVSSTSSSQASARCTESAQKSLIAMPPTSTAMSTMTSMRVENRITTSMPKAKGTSIITMGTSISRCRLISGK